ncbi:MAG TPA: sulfite exporter TauE/SafE family protein [Stellaceae bacterium]|jgi:hypothetical protein|nr:sulfite exporter TauE/SafE family protein [Stellaceae bacterium]
MLTVLHILFALGLGVVAGALGGLFGIGGGVLAIPIFGIAFGLDQQVAQGTTLVMVVPNVLLGFVRYWQRVRFDLRIAGALAGPALIFAYPTARIATGLNPHSLRLAFAIFLAGLSAVIACRTWRNRLPSTTREPLAWGWSAVLGAVGGTISGLFGVGGAFIVPPILTTFFGLRQVEAQGLALALVCPGTMIALATYGGAGQVDWLLGVPLAIGGSLALSAGVTAAQRLSERHLRFAFSGLLIVTAALLAAHG